MNALISLLLFALSGAGPDTAPSRVAVLSPALAEVLVELGVDERVVGIGKFGPWPGGLGDLPVVGGYNAPNFEALLDLEVDLLVNVDSRAADHAHRRAEDLGVAVLALDTSTQEGVFAAIAKLGTTFGRDAQANALTQQIRSDLDKAATAARNAPTRRVLIVVGRDPLFVAGPGSHLDSLLTLAGGENVASDVGQPYAQLSMEAVLERAPEIIIDLTVPGTGGEPGTYPGAWGQWAFLPAVQHGRVHWIHPGQLAIPGVRLGEMAGRIGRLVHPELFGPPTAQDFADPSTTP